MITRDDWLRALAEAGYGDAEHDEQAVTVREFAEMCDLPEYTAARRLQALENRGLAVRTWKKSTGRGGRRVRAVAYRLVEQPKKRKTA